MTRSASFTVTFKQKNTKETSMSEFAERMHWLLATGLNVMNYPLSEQNITVELIKYPPSATIKDINPNAGEIKEIKDGNDADGE